MSNITPKDTTDGWEKRFDERFAAALKSAIAIAYKDVGEQGGEVWAKHADKLIKSFISQELTTARKEGYEKGMKYAEAICNAAKGANLDQLKQYHTASGYESGRKEARKEVVGSIGAKLLANHSPQAVLDAYFEVANDELEKDETTN